ncbi:MAG: stage 0 sporulation protein [Lachnospiraceae bacterium]|nr:stage 0 sporulation protein [Lachnospiraceae bacterium]
MGKIVGVKFKNVSKIYFFDPMHFEIHYDDRVIVETARGIEYGYVVISPMEMDEEKIPKPLKPVIRMATEADREREAENRRKEREAYWICKSKIAERNLEMKLIKAEYTFDNSKVLFYFTADGRIDFRDLVKDLAGIFKTRIELRQVGVRDETKLLGGMGICGRPLCCHTFLTEFAPVSIKMAKEQNLSLNPAKISGSCGRLMCCLKNEADTYAYLSRGLPGKGDQMTAPDGRRGEVQSVDILRQCVKCIVEMDNDERELKEYHIDEISFIPHSKKPKCKEPARTEKAPKKAADGKGKAESPEKKGNEKRAEKPPVPEGAEEGRAPRPKRPRRRKADAQKNEAQKTDAQKTDARKNETNKKGNS